MRHQKKQTDISNRHSSNHRTDKIRDGLLRGGRMTKVAGKAVSYAPNLAGSVFLGLAFLGGSAGQVLAADECGPDGAGATTITCNAGNYAGGGTYPDYTTGIIYTGSDGLALELNDATITVGDPGVRVTSSGAATGDISVTGKNFDTISTTGFNAFGLHSLINNGASTATATTLLTAGDIVTTGNNGFGLYSLTTGLGDALVQMDGGTITTSGVTASGLYSRTIGLGDTLTRMDGGTITTGGISAYGLRSEINNAASTGTATTLLTDGIINTTGNNGFGLYSQTNGLGDTLVQMDGGTIATSGVAASGLYSRTNGPGDALVQMDGGTITTGGISAYGLRSEINNAASKASASTLLTAGDISTAEANAHGLYAQNDGLGEAHVQIDGGSIGTEDEGAHGALAKTSNGNATIELSNGIVTTGADGDGADSEGLFSLVTGGTGTATVTQSGGAIVTDGSNADGIVAQIDGSGVLDGDAIVTQSGGSIETRQDGSSGIVAQTDPGGAGNATVTQSGGASITTAMGGDSFGIVAYAVGSGLATINQVDGSVITSGDGSHGLFAASVGNKSVINQISTGSVVASGLNSDGLNASAALGYDVDVAGSITGGSGFAAGIHTVSPAGGTIDIATGAIVDGSASGIAVRDGDSDGDGIDEIGGNVVITTTGTVTGDTIMGLGDDIFNLIGGSNTGDIYGDDLLASVADGNDAFNWSGGALNSGFFGGNGSDTATISGTAIYDGTEILDGGDDVAIADGWTDTLTFQGITATASAGTIINWENVIIDGGSFTFADAMLTVGSDAGTGLTLRNGATLNASGGFALTGNLANGGVITTQNGSAGDVISISGNYVGNNGLLNIDTVLGDDSSATDKVVISGDSSGSTTVNVQNIGGTGALTINGIEIVEVQGNSTGSFLLNGDFVTATGEQAVVGGAFGYTLVQQADGDWALVSQLITEAPEVPLYQPAAPVYEAFAQNLLTLNTLSTLQQRIGNRNWASTESNQPGEPGYGGWARIIGGRRDVDSDYTTSKTSTDTRYGQIQIGLDIPVYTTVSDQFVAGINASYGQAGTDISSIFGRGDIESDSYSVGLTGTWYANNGLYAGGQLQYSATDSDLNSDTFGGLANDVDGEGLGASIEIGNRIDLLPDSSLSLTPQAQLSYNSVDFESFSGPNDERVSLDDGKSLKARFGLSLDRQGTRTDNSGSVSRHHLYGIANIVHEFEGETKVKVSGVNLHNKTDKTFGEIGLGGTYNWGDDKYSIYGELTAGTSLENFGDSKSYIGTVGFRMKI